MVTLFQEAVDAASDIDGARVSYIPTLEAVIVISRDKDELLSLGTCNNHRLPHRDVRVGCNILWSSVDNTFFAMAVPIGLFIHNFKKIRILQYVPIRNLGLPVRLTVAMACLP